MSSNNKIKSLFDKKIDRRIEEVIKVDQRDAEIIRDEIDEYVVTPSIGRHYVEILERYAETPNRPHEGIAVWVSGFFGSGKSSFAKMLGLSIEDRVIENERASVRFGERTGNDKLQVLLKTITEKIPTHAVIFDVSTDRGIRSGNQTLTEIMYGLFLQSLGYSKDLDLSELEIALETEGRLAVFEAKYQERFKKTWRDDKGLVAFSLGRASEVMHLLEPKTYPAADSWVKGIKQRADISPGKLADRAIELMRRRKPGKNLIFVVDEVGQFVARDVQKMLDLQAIVQNFGVKGRGKQWIVVTSQEKLNELVNGLDDKRIELARLMDRFPLQVHLEPSDISEVTSRRVLSKNAAAQSALGKLYEEHRGRLTELARLTADIKLPEITRDSFIHLYPLLPYQIDLIIQVVSGLRTQGGASKHVGGANRTIIKLAQQLLINPAINLAEESVGALVRLDQIYDLVEGNIGSEIRAKISDIGNKLSHKLAQPVAKVICLLQYVRSVHRSAQNIAAALHPNVSSDSQLALVKEALSELEVTHMVRLGDDGYRIPTPAEDDWERSRNGISPKPGDAHRLYAEVLTSFWQPQPSHTLFDTKVFKAGLAIHGREHVAGDIMFQVHLAEGGKEFEELVAELRKRSQLERGNVFWAIALSDAIDREIVELFRSKEMLTRKERETRSEDTAALMAEERTRLRRHNDELKRLLRAAALSGRVYFRGKDRNPSDKSTDVGKAAAEVLGQVLPEVFDRFEEAAVKSTDVKRGLDALFTADNLQGLPSVFSSLALLRDEKGRPVFRTESGPLKEILDRIEERANYGETASGRYLADELAKEPFGWDFDIVRLLVLALLRGGKIEVTSKSQMIDSAMTGEARETFSNNNVFRQASFRPKRGIEFAQLAQAADAFRDTFGREVTDISSPAPIVAELRKQVERNEDSIASALAKLSAHRLPGGPMLDAALGQMKSIMRGTEDNAISTFNASHKTIKDAIARAADLERALTEPRLHDIERARRALEVAWPVLKGESRIGVDLESRHEQLHDLLQRETFYRDLPAIEQHARVIELEYTRRFDDAQQARMDAYTAALTQLTNVEGWADLADEAKRSVAAPLLAGKEPLPRTAPLPLLRSERDACDGRLKQAIRRVQEILEGERLAPVQIQPYFGGGIDNVEQLDAALGGLREECVRLIGAGKKVVLS